MARAHGANGAAVAMAVAWKNKFDAHTHEPFAVPADDDIKAVTAPWQGMSHGEFTARFVKKIFADLRPRTALPDLRQTIHKWRPDLVVRESAEFAAALAAEEAGLPARVAPHCGTAEMGLITLASDSIDDIRREIGLGPDEGLLLPSEQAFFRLSCLTRRDRVRQPSKTDVSSAGTAPIDRPRRRATVVG
jgi:hypothetical protein